MKIPYSSWELRMALLSLSDDKFNEDNVKEKLEEIKDELNFCPEENKDLNKKIAEHHGISVEKLVDSPNYKILCQEYHDNVIYQFVMKLEKKLGITDKEAWALMVYALGLLD